MWNRESDPRQDPGQTGFQDDDWGSVDPDSEPFRYASDADQARQAEPGWGFDHEQAGTPGQGATPQGTGSSGGAGTFIAGVVAGIILTIGVAFLIEDMDSTGPADGARPADGQSQGGDEWSLLGPAAPSEPLQVQSPNGGEFTLTVSDIKVPLEPDSIYVSPEYDPDNEYLVGVVVDVTNSGTTQLEPTFIYLFDMHDAAGQEAEPYHSEVVNCNRLAETALAPEESRSGCMLWRIPQEYEPTQLEYVDYITLTRAQWTLP